MIYKKLDHDQFSPGQIWATEREGETITIVAIDSYPNGTVFNIVFSDGKESEGINSTLAPIDGSHIEHLLSELIAEDAEITDDLSSYEEWKELAQEGKAGIWTIPPREVLETIRMQVKQGNIEEA